MPLAWALNAAPHNMATGVVVDYGMFAAALITAGWVIWRDRASGPAWHTVTAGLLFALMVAWSGHDSVLIGLAVVLLAVMLVRAIPVTHARLVPVRSPIPAGQAKDQLSMVHPWPPGPCGQARTSGRPGRAGSVSERPWCDVGPIGLDGITKVQGGFNLVAVSSVQPLSMASSWPPAATGLPSAPDVISHRCRGKPGCAQRAAPG